MASKAKANIGLSFDLSAFRQGIRRASTLVKRGLGDRALNPFNKAIRRAFDNMKRRARQAIRTIGRAIFSVKTLFIGFLATLGLSKVKSMIDGMVEGFRSINREMRSFRAVARGNPLFGPELSATASILASLDKIFKLGKFQFAPGPIDQIEALANLLRERIGIDKAEALSAARIAAAKGLGPAATGNIMSLSSILGRVFEQEAGEVARKLVEALEGNGIGGLSDFGINPAAIAAQISDPVQQGVVAVEQLIDMVDNMNIADLADGFRTFEGAIAALRENIGKIFFDMFGPTLEVVGRLIQMIKHNAAIIGGMFSGIAQTIHDTIVNLSTFVGSMFGGTPAANNFLEKLWEYIKTAFNNPLGLLAPVILPIIDTVLDIWNKLHGLLMGMFDVWRGIFHVAVETVLDGIFGILKWIPGVSGKSTQARALVDTSLGSLTSHIVDAMNNFHAGSALALVNIRDHVANQQKNIRDARNNLAWATAFLGVSNTFSNTRKALTTDRNQGTFNRLGNAASMVPQSAMVGQFADAINDQNARIEELLIQINGNLTGRSTVLQLSENRPSYYRNARPARRRR